MVATRTIPRPWRIIRLVVTRAPLIFRLLQVFEPLASAHLPCSHPLHLPRTFYLSFRILLQLVISSSLTVTVLMHRLPHVHLTHTSADLIELVQEPRCPIQPRISGTFRFFVSEQFFSPVENDFFKGVERSASLSLLELVDDVWSVALRQLRRRAQLGRADYGHLRHKQSFSLHLLSLFQNFTLTLRKPLVGRTAITHHRRRLPFQSTSFSVFIRVGRRRRVLTAAATAPSSFFFCQPDHFLRIGPDNVIHMMPDTPGQGAQRCALLQDLQIEVASVAPSC